MGRRSALSLLLSSALLVACGETHVTLLPPLDAHAGGSGTSDAGPSLGADASDAGGTASPPVQLIHRYRFDGEGTRVVDSIGAAHGTLQGGASLDGAGHATLDGVDDYVNLPNGLLSGLTDATLIAWLVWNGGPCWQRVFDFGSTDAGEDAVGNATSSWFATPKRCPGAGPATAFETTNVLGSIDSDEPFPVLQRTSLAVVIDNTAQELRLYVAGRLLGTGKAAPLALLSDENDWLGRSQWVQDTYLRGTYDEFRIYDEALGTDELALIEAAGPDALAP